MDPNREKKSDVFYSVAEMQNAAENDMALMSGEKAGYYTVNCMLSWIMIDENQQRQMFYLACPVTKKKVLDEAGGFWCETCQKTYPEAVPTWNYTGVFSDLSGSVVAGMLGEVGDNFMGMTCKDFYEVHKDLE